MFDQIDKFTNKVAKMAVFMDQQSMRMDDQSILYLANKLKNENKVEATEQLNNHANRKNNNVETAYYLKDNYVDRKVENSGIDERVNYRTITMSFYQDNTVKRMMVENEKLEDYRPKFFSRL